MSSYTKQMAKTCIAKRKSKRDCFVYLWACREWFPINSRDYNEITRLMDDLQKRGKKALKEEMEK